MFAFFQKVWDRKWVELNAVDKVGPCFALETAVENEVRDGVMLGEAPKTSW